MLITELKSKESLLSLTSGKVFLLNCHGCKEMRFPEAEALELEKELALADRLAGVLTTEYICNPENLALHLEPVMAQVEEADAIFVLSCGVGVQTVAQCLTHKRVYAACDTYRLPGFQGVTPLEHDCRQCGQCYLNITGGICPITACSKSLINGQCGGAKNGKCEVDPNMDCGWERIHQKLKKLGRLDAMKCPVQLRDYSVEK